MDRVRITYLIQKKVNEQWIDWSEETYSIPPSAYSIDKAIYRLIERQRIDTEVHVFWRDQGIANESI